MSGLENGEDSGQPSRGGARPIKIVYFNPTGNLGGAELCLLDTLSGVRATRPDWTLKVLLAEFGPLSSALKAIGVATEVLPFPSRLSGLGDSTLKLNASSTDRFGRFKKLLRLSGTIPGAALSAVSYLGTLRRALRVECPDLLHTNGMKAHLLGAWAASRKLPVVWQLQDYASTRALMSKLLRASRRPRLQVVGASNSVSDDLRALLGPNVPVERIYNAIDLDNFSPGTPAELGNDPGAWLDQVAGLPAATPGTIRVGLVATYARWKGHDVFLKAASLVGSAHPARFYIVGGPIYRSAGSQFSLEELQAEAGRLGLNGRVGFVPHQARPAEVFRSLDIVVHASTRPEPFGRVIVEGMACGRAVIAIEEGGSGELFEDDVSALGCPSNDPEALAERIQRLLGSQELRARLGVAGRAAVERNFDRNQLGDAWVQLYESVLRKESGIRVQRDCHEQESSYDQFHQH